MKIFERKDFGSIFYDVFRLCEKIKLNDFDTERFRERPNTLLHQMYISNIIDFLVLTFIVFRGETKLIGVSGLSLAKANGVAQAGEFHFVLKRNRPNTNGILPLLEQIRIAKELGYSKVLIAPTPYKTILMKHFIEFINKNNLNQFIISDAPSFGLMLI